MGGDCYLTAFAQIPRGGMEPLYINKQSAVLLRHIVPEQYFPSW